MNFLPKTSDMKVLDEMIQRVGFAGLRNALMQLAHNKVLESTILGTPKDKWEKIVKIAHTLPKR